MDAFLIRLSYDAVSIDDWVSNEYGCYTFMKKILYENIVVVWLTKKFLAFHRTRSSISLLAKARYWTSPFLVFN
jgi:hypothetical protein